MGIVFEEFSFPGYIYFVIVSFPFSTLEKENPYFWHIEPAPPSMVLPSIGAVGRDDRPPPFWILII